MSTVFWDLLSKLPVFDTLPFCYSQSLVALIWYLSLTEQLTQGVGKDFRGDQGKLFLVMAKLAQ